MKEIIRKYIANLTYEDVYTYIKNKGCHVSKKDISFIYEYVKKNCDKILNKDENCLNDIKDNVEPDTYQSILDLYNKYKDYI